MSGLSLSSHGLQLRARFLIAAADSAMTTVSRVSLKGGEAADGWKAVSTDTRR